MPVIASGSLFDSTSLKGQRRAVSVFFAFNGLMFATWASEIPRIKTAHGLSDLGLGAVLLAVTVGAVLALPLVGRAITRFGGPGVVVAATASGTIALLAVPLADEIHTLGLFLLAFGCAFGALDVALNNAGVQLEREAQRSLISGLHALYSLGALLGALIGAALIWAGVGTHLHFGVLVPMALVLTVGVAAGIPSDGRQDVGRRARAPAAPRLPTWPVLALGLIAACAAVAEGGVGDWAGVYLKETALSPAGVDALGFGAFSLTMLIGRAFGDRLTERFGACFVGQVAAAIATLGVVVALGLPSPGPAIFGLGLLGLGLSVIAPLAFSAVGRAAPQNTSAAIAMVTAFFYCGYLASPPLIGALAELSSLRTALVVLVAATLGAAVLAPMLHGEARGRPRSAGQASP